MGHEGVISLSILGWPGDFCSPFPPVDLLKSKRLVMKFTNPQQQVGKMLFNSVF